MLSNANNKERLHQWITSLAITIVCCAGFFLVFSGNFLDLHKEVTVARVESGMLEARLNHLESHIMWEHRRQKAGGLHAAPTPPAPVQVQMQAPGAESVPLVAVPMVGNEPAAAPSAPSNMPHEFNPDEPIGIHNATPIVAPVKP
ncbi:MAG: hypothetical protein WBK91_04930 [Alphaproteobacteria bacterium]